MVTHLPEDQGRDCLWLFGRKAASFLFCAGLGLALIDITHVHFGTTMHDSGELGVCH